VNRAITDMAWMLKRLETLEYTKHSFEEGRVYERRFRADALQPNSYQQSEPLATRIPYFSLSPDPNAVNLA